MTYLVERLAELAKHLDHLRELRPRVGSVTDLQKDLSLHNDVLFSLLTLCQLVIDVSGELSSSHGLRFEDYTEAVRNLAHLDLPLDSETLEALGRLPGFRNVMIHEYISLDLERVMEALDRLQPVEEFSDAVRHYLESRS